MRRKAKIKQIVEAIDNKVYDPHVRNDQLLKDALYSYRDSLVQEFYDASNTKPTPKKEPI
jgi:hypothetical protein